MGITSHSTFVFDTWMSYNPTNTNHVSTIVGLQSYCKMLAVMLKVEQPSVACFNRTWKLVVRVFFGLEWASVRMKVIHGGKVICQKLDSLAKALCL